jgi:delta1-piperideine-2-carboxylate reductase
LQITMTAPVTTAESGANDVRIEFDDLVELIARILVRHGASAFVAAVLANNCASAERDGSRSHGIFRVQGYVSTLQSGWVDGHAEPQVEERAGAFLAVDAKNGFAQPAVELVRPMLVARARTFGIALAAIRD